MNAFEKLLGEKTTLLADGATGTNFFKMGLQSGDAPELWNVDHPDRVASHYRSFIDAGSDIVLVSEDPGDRPGFPPLETNVIFWKQDKRYRLKIFAPAASIAEPDLPVAWLLPALEDTGDAECC